MTVRLESPKPDRLNSFSDAVFAVIITILVLELRPPQAADIGAALDLWPIAISYLVIAIVWVNRHHLLHQADATKHRLVWLNFRHLFSVSLAPFSTAWIAETKLASFPVAFYAGVFVLVNATYLLLCREVIDGPGSRKVTVRERTMMRVRSWMTLAAFAAAALVAPRSPATGMVMICLCFLVYLRREAPGRRSAEQAGKRRQHEGKSS